MNVFAVSSDPIECARALDDRRLIKMVLETAQIVCTAIQEANYGIAVPYKPTHRYHPCVIWACEPTNLLWLCRLFEELSKEYTLRFKKVHKCSFLMCSPITNIRARFSHIKDALPVTWANCAANRDLRIDFKNIRDTHKAYQLYLCARWTSEIIDFKGSASHYSPRWTNVQPPVWVVDALAAAQSEALRSIGPRRAPRSA